MLLSKFTLSTLKKHLLFCPANIRNNEQHNPSVPFHLFPLFFNIPSFNIPIVRTTANYQTIKIQNKDKMKERSASNRSTADLVSRVWTIISRQVVGDHLFLAGHTYTCRGGGTATEIGAAISHTRDRERCGIKVAALLVAN